MNFNCKFARPAVDLCTSCAELDAKIKYEENAVAKSKFIVESIVHKRKANTVYTGIKIVSEKSENRDDFDMISFDFKQNIPFPHLTITDIFYSRQLCLYIFGIYSAKLKRNVIYACPETACRRGAIEVISCLQYYF